MLIIVCQYVNFAFEVNFLNSYSRIKGLHLEAQMPKASKRILCKFIIINIILSHQTKNHNSFPNLHTDWNTPQLFRALHISSKLPT